MDNQPGRIPLDQNRRNVAAGVSTSDGLTVLPLEVDPLTGQLQVSSSGGGGGGTQYTTGSTTATHPIGNMLVFDNGGTIADITASQGLPVNIVGGGGAGGTSSNFAATFPTAGTAIGATDGTNMQPLKVDASKNLFVSLNTALPAGTNAIGSISNTSFIATQSTATSLKTQTTGAGTAGTPDSGVVTVQGVTSMTPLKTDSSATTQPVSGTVTANAGTGTFAVSATSLPLPTGAATSANQPTNAAQGSTTSGQTGTLIEGAVTTSSPTYTTAQTSPLSLDTSGNLRVNVVAGGASGGTSSSFSSAFPSTGTAIGATDGTNMKPLNVDVSGNLKNISQSGSTTAVTQATASNLKAQITGTGTAGTADAGVVTVQGIASMTALKVDGSAVTQPVSGTVTANAGTGSFTVAQATAANLNATVVGTGTFAVQAAVASVSATGSSVPASGNYTAGIAETTLPTATSAGQLTGTMVDKFGRQVVLPNGTRDIVNPITQLTLTSTTTETSLIGAVASTFNDLLSLIVINTSATATQVDFRDSTGGTVRLSIYVPAGDTRGAVFHSPMPQATVNTAWTAKCGTSVASVIITGQYIANK